MCDINVLKSSGFMVYDTQLGVVIGFRSVRGKGVTLGGRQGGSCHATAMLFVVANIQSVFLAPSLPFLLQLFLFSG